MQTLPELGILLALAFYVISYRNKKSGKKQKSVLNMVGDLYNKYAPYSFQVAREKAKELGQEYTTRQYVTQIILLGGFAGLIGYFYFYSLIWGIVYGTITIMFVPYLAYLRCQRIYSEFIFEQIQTYTTNVIMEFNTVQSFVKALEGVRDSGLLEDPIQSDLKKMIDMSYENGTIDESIEYFNSKYPFYIVKNMHQLFLQITKEGARDAGESLENMSMDIDSLVEGVYRDQMDRKNFHGRFVTFGAVLFSLVLVVQFLLGKKNYIELIDMVYVAVIVHAIIIINAYFLITGEKYYNEDVGAE
jgi:hypothetical protein